MKKKNERLTFEKAAEIKAAQAENLRLRKELNEKEAEAHAELEQLRSEYQASLVEGVEKGIDNDAALNQSADKIAEAEKVVTRRAAESEVARRHFNARYTDEEIKAAFRDFKKSYYEAELLPILESIRSIKGELTKAMREYDAAVDHYDTQKRQAWDLIPQLRADVFGRIGPLTRRELNHFFITIETLKDLQAKRTPAGVEIDQGENEE